MSRSRSRSDSRKRSPSLIDRKFPNANRSVSRDSVRGRKLSKEIDRTRYQTRSFTRSRSPPITHSKYSRSKSRSPSFKRKSNRRRSNSRTSPFDSEEPRRRHVGTREHPEKSRCLGVFGLSESTTKHQLKQIFTEYGPIDRVQVVVDAKSGRSRGYCFVYYERMEDATRAKEACSGMTLDSRRIRVDYSITQRPHTPTPGIYKGQPIRRHQRSEHEEKGHHRRSGGGGGGGGGGAGGHRGNHRRSSSMDRRRRNRSRSASPRPESYRRYR